jgi:hypothetical protein
LECSSRSGEPGRDSVVAYRSHGVESARRDAFTLCCYVRCTSFDRCIGVCPGAIDGSSRVIDFWVRSGADEHFIVVGQPGAQTALEIDGTPVALHYFNAAEREANRAKIGNIERMLPTISMCRELVPDSLVSSLERVVTAPMALGEIERRFHPGDPTPVRAAVYQLLLAGRLLCPELATNPLSSLSMVGPAAAKS